ncbi:hypothetical protein T4A_3465 [Trichinella pseudospiralis]|uniref:Uncharacterized protein n=1 Tax=Trichinella pseudospiralis TaxID=6337 RepID=A0A0V1E356_TRIPS|nr:hypothetical protein T4A_3465 [Trichinella pseudospiralis]
MTMHSLTEKTSKFRQSSSEWWRRDAEKGWTRVREGFVLNLIKKNKNDKNEPLIFISSLKAQKCMLNKFS